MDNRKKLYLIDAYALIFRGYYAFIKNPRINSKGMDTSAIMGFMNSVLDLIKREKPENLAVFHQFETEYEYLPHEVQYEYQSIYNVGSVLLFRSLILQFGFHRINQ